MTQPTVAQDISSSPFVHKREGRFDEAFKGYAGRLAQAQAEKNLFVAEQVFDQLFDVLLLKYLKERIPFSNVSEIQRQMRSDIKDVLQDLEAYDRISFDNHFARCWKRYSPRGRAQSPFSVDKELLLRNGFEAGVKS